MTALLDLSLDEELDDLSIVEWAQTQHQRALRPGALDWLIHDTTDAKKSILQASLKMARFNLLSAAEIRQGLWDWIWDHPGRRRSIAHRRRDWDTATWERRTRGNFWREMMAVARSLVERERQRRFGTGLHDHAWWTIDTVRMMLTLPALDTAMTRPPVTAIEGGSLVEQDTNALWVTTVITFRQALHQVDLSDQVREALQRVLVDDVPARHVAFQMDLDVRTVQKRVNTGLQAIADHLNGGPTPLLDLQPVSEDRQTAHGPMEAAA